MGCVLIVVLFVRIDILQILVSVVALIEACLAADDPVGMRAGFSCLAQLTPVLLSSGSEEFVLTRLLPCAFLSPARPEFRLTQDAQFVLALNEAAHCVHAINAAKVCFCTIVCTYLYQ